MRKGKVSTGVYLPTGVGGGARVAGVCGRGHAWQGDRAWQWGHPWHGVGVHVGEHAWKGGHVCMAGETSTAADGTHPTGMHSCFFSKN